MRMRPARAERGRERRHEPRGTNRVARNGEASAEARAQRREMTFMCQGGGYGRDGAGRRGVGARARRHAVGKRVRVARDAQAGTLAAESTS